MYYYAEAVSVQADSAADDISSDRVALKSKWCDQRYPCADFATIKKDESMALQGMYSA
jgi:hypothetical protein